MYEYQRKSNKGHTTPPPIRPNFKLDKLSWRKEESNSHITFLRNIYIEPRPSSILNKIQVRLCHVSYGGGIPS